MQLGADLIRRLLATEWDEHILLNVNFPDCDAGDVKGVEVTSQGRRDQDFVRIEDRLDTRGNPYYWLGFNARAARFDEGTDLWAVKNGSISVTPLNLNLTHHETCKKLRLSLRG